MSDDGIPDPIAKILQAVDGREDDCALLAGAFAVRVLERFGVTPTRENSLAIADSVIRIAGGQAMRLKRGEPLPEGGK
jgi:hypothetical protein